jgi:hypothetical protein
VDRSKVKALVDANIDAYLDAFGIGYWSITVKYEQCSNPDWAAECDRNGGDYEIAVITIDPARYGDDEDEQVLKSLRHELFHIVLAPFDLHRDAACCHIDKDSEMDRVESRVWTHSVEAAVKNLERMYRGMCEMQITKDPEPVAEPVQAAEPARNGKSDKILAPAE